MPIPVTFTLNNSEYKGTLEPVAGSGNNVTFHLTVRGKHWGELSYIEGSPGINGLHSVASGWRFTSNIYPELEGMGDYFGDVILAWYQ